mmetsp:Transcript_30201/g.59155  ORF Transcript_30201/g.59155 Transcript_30201/m.59155 type:complete len:91 (+) Transcript_30201:714-986(+)
MKNNSSRSWLQYHQSALAPSAVNEMMTIDKSNRSLRGRTRGCPPRTMRVKFPAAVRRRELVAVKSCVLRGQVELWSWGDWSMLNVFVKNH